MAYIVGVVGVWGQGLGSIGFCFQKLGFRTESSEFWSRVV